MYKHTVSGGQYWTSREEPRWTDWRGRQAFKYRHISPGRTARTTSR